MLRNKSICRKKICSSYFLLIFLCFNSLKLLSAKYKLHVRYIFAEQKSKKRTVYVIYIQMRLPLKEGAYISCRMEYLSPFS